MEYMLLKFDDKTKIKGESTLEGFKDCIEVMSYSHGVANYIQFTTSNTGRSTGRPDIQELSVTKNLDLTTPLLNFHCCKASNLGTTQLYLVRQDASTDDGRKNALAYMVYEMTDTMISNVSVGGGGGSIPTETLSLNFSQLKWTYKSQKPDVGVEGTVEQSWNQATNTGQ